MAGYKSVLESDSEKYNSDSTVLYEYADSTEEQVTSCNLPYLCSYAGCVRTFKKSSRLRDHILSHSGLKQYKCSYEDCANAYTRSAHLKRHIASIHSRCTDIFVCDWDGCGKKYSSRAALRKHTDRSHKNTDNYKCTVEGCSETFTKRFQLRHHLFVHQGTLAFQCSIESCGKIFQQTSHLRRHMKMHDGYACTVENCQLKFQNWSLLRKHMSSDHKRVHKCDKCDKECSTKSMLRRHITIMHPTENGVPLYKCSYTDCTRSYPDLSNLNNHIRVNHKKELFLCQADGCTQSFTSKLRRDKHVAKLHAVATIESIGDFTATDAQKPKKKRTNEHRKKTIAEKLCGIVDGRKSAITTTTPAESARRSAGISAVTDTVQATAKLDISER